MESGLFPEYHLCSECNSKHSPFRPHNALSPFYRDLFLSRYGREPSWLDAMRHCSPFIQQIYIRMLTSFELNIENGDLIPKDPAFPEEISYEKEEEKNRAVS